MYSTSTQLKLRQDHAFARDAVQAELDLSRDLGDDFAARWDLFEVRSRASSKTEYLMRPDLGREFDPAARSLIVERCPPGADLQVVIGDGLSATAVRGQVPPLLPLLAEGAVRRGWQFGRPFVVRYARVGLLNEVGPLLGATVVVLLIGERPGLSTAESLSAYMAWRPQPDDTDARRNLISNIHDRGLPVAEAAERILALATRMMAAGISGATLKEDT